MLRFYCNIISLSIHSRFTRSASRRSNSSLNNKSARRRSALFAASQEWWQNFRQVHSRNWRQTLFEGLCRWSRNPWHAIKHSWFFKMNELWLDTGFILYYNFQSIIQRNFIVLGMDHTLNVLDMDRVVVNCEGVRFCQILSHAWFKITLNGANENLVQVNIIGITS